LRDFHRRKGRCVFARLTEDSDPPTRWEATGGNGDVAILSPRAKAVRLALKKLRPKAREIVQRKLCWDQPTTEIARTLCVKADTVRSTVHRNRAALRRRLITLVGLHVGDSVAD
jgi:DNA-directed RNA polymerase specialized sigma24 family protein